MATRNFPPAVSINSSARWRHNGPEAEPKKIPICLGVLFVICFIRADRRHGLSDKLLWRHTILMTNLSFMSAKFKRRQHSKQIYVKIKTWLHMQLAWGDYNRKSLLCTALGQSALMSKRAKQSHNTPMDALGGGYSSYSFTTSALYGSEWSASRPGHALPPVPMDRKLGGHHNWSRHRG
jgi:hypothetical protein